jgi:hypothetical protein
MRTILKKIGALLLAVGALSALLAQAALTHGCGSAPARQGEAQAPTSAPPGREPAPTPAAEDYEDKGYMGATKAPPMEAFRPAPKSPASADVEERVDARDDNAQQQAP